jgi:hypothetical protein
MGLAAVGLAVGFFYRISAAVLFLSYTYVFLIDKTYYTNHFYLFGLLSFLFLCADAHRWASVDRLRDSRLRSINAIPYWQIFLFKAQIATVYFYGGIAKLNGDWLRGEPLRSWLAQQGDLLILGVPLNLDWATYSLSYGGLIFDLLIGWALLWRSTRYWAIGISVVFHLMNHQFFSIGMFPFLMIAASVLFLDDGWPRRLCQRFKKGFKDGLGTSQENNSTSFSVFRKGQQAITIFVMFYLLVQILVPLRHYLYKQDVRWIEGDFGFGWHMMRHRKRVVFKIKVVDPSTNKTWDVNPYDDLSSQQAPKFIQVPKMIAQYAAYLKEKYRALGVENPAVYVTAWASLNGRPLQLFIDPKFNMAEAKIEPFVLMPWVVPLELNPSEKTIGILNILLRIVLILAVAGVGLLSYLIFKKKEVFSFENEMILFGFLSILGVITTLRWTYLEVAIRLSLLMAMVVLAWVTYRGCQMNREGQKNTWGKGGMIFLAGSLSLVLVMALILTLQP